MDTLIDQCIAREVPVLGDGHTYSIDYIPAIGEVITRDDGYYAVSICNVSTPADAGPYYATQLRYMTFAPFILFLLQSDSSLLTSDFATRLFAELNTLFGLDPSTWFVDNGSYLTQSSIIWIHYSNTCEDQVPNPALDSTTFRSTYDYFINCGIQNINPECD